MAQKNQLTAFRFALGQDILIEYDIQHTMRILLTKLAKSPGLVQSAYTVVGNAGATGVSAVALLLISRILGPIKFGEFSVGFSLVLILSRVIDFGLGPAIISLIPSQKKPQSISKIVAYSLLLKILLAIVVIVIGIAITPTLIKFLNFSEPMIIYLAFLITISVVLYEHLLSVLQALHRFASAVFINLIQSTSKLLFVVLMILFHQSSEVVIFFLYIFVPIIPALLYKIFTPEFIKLKFIDNFSEEKKLLVSIVPHTAFGFIISAIVDNIDIILVRGYLNAYDTGLLSGVSKIAMFLMLFAYSLGSVLYPRVAKYKLQTDLLTYIKKASLIAILAIVGYFTYLPFAKLSILLTIGADYLPGITVLNILVASAFLTLILVPFQALFYTFKAPWYFSVTAIIQLIITLCGNIFFVPIYGLDAAAWTRFVCRLVLCIFTIAAGMYLYYKKYIHAKI